MPPRPSLEDFTRATLTAVRPDGLGLESGYEKLHAHPLRGVLPADAILRHVPHPGALYRVDAIGVHRLTAA